MYWYIVDILESCLIYKIDWYVIYNLYYIIIDILQRVGWYVLINILYVDITFDRLDILKHSLNFWLIYCWYTIDTLENLFIWDIYYYWYIIEVL